MKTAFRITANSACLVAALLVFASCENDPGSPDITNDFFPLVESIEWEYQPILSVEGADPQELDRTGWKVGGDTIIEEKTYKQIVNLYNGHLVKVIRKEGSKYFGRRHELYGSFSHEYVFLDVALTTGDSWHYLKFDGATKTEYVVKATGATHIIEGTTFKDVLEIEANYYDRVDDDVYELRYTTEHYYAKGVGEIYSYYPPQASAHFEGTLTTNLVRFKH